MSNKQTIKISAHYEDVYNKYFKDFLHKVENIDNSYQAYFIFFNTLNNFLPHAVFSEVIDDIVYEAYLKHVKFLLLEQLLDTAQHIDEIVQSEYEQRREDGGIWNKNDVFNIHSIAGAEHEFQKPYLAYFVLAIMQFSEVLPDLKSSKPSNLINQFLDIQKSLDRGITMFQLSQLQERFSNYINISKDEMAEAVEKITLKFQNERKEIASRAGKARSNQKYAAIKEFVIRRFNELKGDQEFKSWNQLALKICKEIENNNIPHEVTAHNIEKRVNEWVLKLKDDKTI